MISWLWFWILKKKKCRSAPWWWPFTLKVKTIVWSNSKIAWSADQTLKSSQMIIPQGFLLFSSLVSDWTPSWGDHYCQTKLYVCMTIDYSRSHITWLCITGDRLWARFLGWGEILSRFLLSLVSLHILHLSPLCRLRSPSSSSICTVFYLSSPTQGLVAKEKKIRTSEIWIWKMQREYKYWELKIWIWNSGPREGFLLENPIIL